MTQQQQHTYEEPNYMGVFYALIVLTLIELWAANQTAAWGRNGVIIALVGLAFAKAALVALWYMHLKFERWILYLVSFVPIVLVGVLLSGTMPDISEPPFLKPYFGDNYPKTHLTEMQKGDAPAKIEHADD